MVQKQINKNRNMKLKNAEKYYISQGSVIKNIRKKIILEESV